MHHQLCPPWQLVWGPSDSTLCTGPDGCAHTAGPLSFPCCLPRCHAVTFSFHHLLLRTEAEVTASAHNNDAASRVLRKLCVTFVISRDSIQACLVIWESFKNLLLSNCFVLRGREGKKGEGRERQRGLPSAGFPSKAQEAMPGPCQTWDPGTHSRYSVGVAGLKCVSHTASSQSVYWQEAGSGVEMELELRCWDDGMWASQMAS